MPPSSAGNRPGARPVGAIPRATVTSDRRGYLSRVGRHGAGVKKLATTYCPSARPEDNPAWLSNWK